MLILIALVGCSNSNSSLRELEEVSDTLEVELTIDRLINLSSNIIVGEVQSIKSFDKGINIINVQLSEELKGSIGTIDQEVYVSSEYTIGDNYIFFLEFFESALYDGKVFKPIGHATLNNNEITDFFHLSSILNPFENGSEVITDLNKLSNYIKKVDDKIKTNKSNVYAKIIQTTDVNVLVNESDYICEIIPYRLITSNPVLNYMECKVTKNYKGKLKDDIVVFLPKDAKLDQEYLVFLYEKGNNVYEVNSSISFIDKEDEKEYTKVLKDVLK